MALAAPACAHSGQAAHKYDLAATCDYSFESREEFKSLPEANTCTLNKANREGSRFFSSYVTADKEILKGNGSFGNFEIKNGKPKLTIRSYEDEARGVQQKLISSKNLTIGSNAKNYATLSVISVAYSKPTSDANTLEDVEETYQCLNSITYGKKTAVLASLCDLQPKGSADLNDWQMELLRSVKVN